MKRSIKFTAVALSFLFVGSTLTACSNSSKDQDSYKQSVNARRESLRKSREEKSSAENEQIKKANDQLAQDLKGNQDDANNGDHNYDYSTYVERIEIKSATQAHVYVDESFMNLDDEVKTKVGNSISNLILRSMATSGMDIQPEDQKRGIYLAFYTGGNKALGHSRFTNYNEYKFY
ncbi:hypothetical protein [Lactobacillus johnsonii]|uniref:hypothetical protein n=1 Tax=Lactobacillus johnsonii TaxID=33959 RepID=UPI0022E830AF|nr:hypothetical protein [Lactobacillus johnsonii]